MNGDDILGFAKKVLPWIGAAATGNVPALIAMAAKTVQDTLGVEVEPTPEAVASAVAGATPEQIIALKAADNDFALKMREFGYKESTELVKMSYDDTANARAREISTSDVTPKVLAAVIVLGWFLIQGFLLTEVVAVPNKDLVMRALGTLDMALALVLGYYFGSSASSKRKDQMLQAQGQGRRKG